MTGFESLRTVRRGHEAAVLDQLTRGGPLSRRDLINRTGLSRTTLLALVTDLIDRGALVELPAERDRPRRGRPLQLVGLNPRGGVWISVEVAPARVRVAFANAAREVVAVDERPIARDASRTVKSRAVNRLIDETAAAHGITLGALRKIALATVTPLAPGEDGTHIDLDAMAVARRLERRFAAGVIVDNNTRLAAYAESAWGVARGLSDVIYVRLADNVSAGIITGGRVVPGARGTSGAIGHLRVDLGSERCECGGVGCLDTVLGVPGLITAAAQRGVDVADGPGLLAKVREGDPTVNALLARGIDSLVGILAPLVAGLDPDAVVIGGALSKLNEQVISPLRIALAAALGDGGRRPPDVRAGELDRFAGVIGGLAVMLDSLFDPTHLEGRIATGTLRIAEEPPHRAPS